MLELYSGSGSLDTLAIKKIFNDPYEEDEFKNYCKTAAGGIRHLPQSTCMLSALAQLL